MLSTESYNTVFPEFRSTLFETGSTDVERILQWMGPNQLLDEPSADVVAAIQRHFVRVESICKKYESAMISHFLQFAAPIIHSSGIVDVQQTLEGARKHYEFPYQYILDVISASDHIQLAKKISAKICASFDRAFKALVRRALPYDTLQAKMFEFYEQRNLCDMDTEMVNLYHAMCDFGLVKDMERIFSMVLRRDVTNHVTKAFAKHWTSSVLGQYEIWARDAMMPAVQVMVGEGSWQQLVELGHDALAELRIQELFDIVVHYPESIPALNDLKECMRTSSQRAAAVSTFQQSCQRRLLQGSANTVDIISAYISTIRAFSVLEPRGVLLDKVSKPIRRYLRDRDETIRVIVAGMLDEEDSGVNELAAELSNSRNDQEDEVDGLMDMSWVPDPIDAPPDFMKGKHDIVSSLISIYENKDVFVKEFIDIFADRLLKEDCVDDVMYSLELLKLQFGERELLNLDVMIRDIKESKRIDKKIHQEGVRGKPIYKKFHSNILSRLYWPKFRQSALELPPAIEAQMDMYAERYSAVMSHRKLQWLPNLGTVTLEIQLEDRTVAFTVSPEQAAVIAHFQTQAQSLQQVEERFDMTPAYARQIVMFWVHKGVLKQDGDKFVVRETVKDDDSETESIPEDDMDSAGGGGAAAASSNIQSAEERAKEEMSFYWSYINGMLTNLGAVPVDRVHSFLKMVVPKETPYTKSLEELEHFLDVMVSEEKLVMSGTNYKLPGK